MMQQHFVTFYSPGTFVAETNTKPIDDWDVETAVEIARSITQRYGARPYGFRFSTRAREDDELDSRTVKSSGFYWLGGRLRSIKDVEEEANPDERILLQNMKSNGWDYVVTNDNSWRWTQPFNEKDELLDVHL